MNENKSLDGIKKLSKDEIKKARRILLDYIGEDSSPKPSETKAKSKKEKSKSMDGILGGINFKKREKREKREKEKKLNTKKEREALKKELGFTDKKDDKKQEKTKSDELGGAFLRMAEKSERKVERENARKIARVKELELEKASKIEEEKSLQLKREEEKKKKDVLEEEKRKREEEKKTARIKEELEKEKKHLAKVKKEEAEKRKREKIEKELALKKEKERNKKERKKKIKKRIKLYKHRAHKKILNIYSELKEKKSKIILSILLLFMISLLIYLSFVFFLIKFNPDNKLTRMIANYLPVPALISPAGVLQYYDYVDKKNIFINELNIQEGPLLNKAFAIDIVVNSLARKFGIDRKENNFQEQLELNLMHDIDANSVGIKRIQKIKDLIDSGENFVQVSSKYGDRVDKIDFPSEEKAVEKFGNKLSGLKIDEISDVVVNNDGYYIFKRYKKNNSFSLSYVYISSVDLDYYLDELVSELKVWSLVD